MNQPAADHRQAPVNPNQPQDDEVIDPTRPPPAPVSPSASSTALGNRSKTLQLGTGKTPPPPPAPKQNPTLVAAPQRPANTPPTHQEKAKTLIKMLLLATEDPKMLKALQDNLGITQMQEEIRTLTRGLEEAKREKEELKGRLDNMPASSLGAFQQEFMSYRIYVEQLGQIMTHLLLEEREDGLQLALNIVDTRLSEIQDPHNNLLRDLELAQARLLSVQDQEVEERTHDYVGRIMFKEGNKEDPAEDNARTRQLTEEHPQKRQEYVDTLTRAKLELEQAERKLMTYERNTSIKYSLALKGQLKAALRALEA